MTDIRRTLLWVVFTMSLVLLWDAWNKHTGQPSIFGGAPPRPAATAPAPEGGAASAPGVPAPAATSPGATTAATPAPAGALPAGTTAATSERVDVTTDLMKATFDTKGGDLVRLELLAHRDQVDPSRNVVLFDQSSQRVYLAQTGLISARAGAALPNHLTPMTLVSGERELAAGRDKLELRFETADVGGSQLVKTYTLERGKYTLGVRHELVNTSAAAIEPQLYLQLVRDGNKPSGESMFYSTFTGPAVYTDAKKYQKVEFSDIEKGKIDIEKTSTNGYVAMVQHYFASAWLLADGAQRDLFMRKVDTNLYSVGMITPLGEIAPGQSKAVDARLFAGPQIETLLEKLAPGLELVKDYGWLTILAKPLYWLLDQLHKVLGNWGWSIVALVFLLKIAFYWLNAKAYASMAKMKAINPR